jgi:hypothetical protein
VGVGRLQDAWTGVPRAARLLARAPRARRVLGTLVNAWLAEGGEAAGVRAGTLYADVGTLEGYRMAMELLAPEGPARMAL